VSAKSSGGGIRDVCLTSRPLLDKGRVQRLALLIEMQTCEQPERMRALLFAMAAERSPDSDRAADNIFPPFPVRANGAASIILYGPTMIMK